MRAIDPVAPPCRPIAQDSGGIRCLTSDVAVLDDEERSMAPDNIPADANSA
ncbi:hypothetical protein GCM10027265_05460 [Jatrophihabitans fulvus]